MAKKKTVKKTTPVKKTPVKKTPVKKTPASVEEPAQEEEETRRKVKRYTLKQKLQMSRWLKENFDPWITHTEKPPTRIVVARLMTEELGFKVAHTAVGTLYNEMKAAGELREDQVWPHGHPGPRNAEKPLLELVNNHVTAVIAERLNKLEQLLEIPRDSFTEKENSEFDSVLVWSAKVKLQWDKTVAAQPAGNEPPAGSEAVVEPPAETSEPACRYEVEEDAENG